MYRLFNYNLKDKLLTFPDIISSFHPSSPRFSRQLWSDFPYPNPPPPHSAADIICERFLIAIVLLLIEREHEPRKHINIDLIKAKLIFVLTNDVTVDFGKSLLITNSFETKDLHSNF